MNLSPLQLDTNCFTNNAHYYPSYYSHDASAWSSSTSLLCPSTPVHYPSSSPPALQSIENYCQMNSYYPMINAEPLSSSSEVSFHPIVPQCPPVVSSQIYPSEDCLPEQPTSSSSSSGSAAMMLPQNRANYTRHQLIMLNEIFREHKYPNSLQKTLIAKYIGVSRDQIRIWFQNKRRKVQLISKGQARQTKTDVECEYGEYRQHLPKNYLVDLFDELYKARGAPARLPVKRENSNKINNSIEQEQIYPVYYQPMHPSQYYPPIESNPTSRSENEISKYSTDYSQHMYADRL